MAHPRSTTTDSLPVTASRPIVRVGADTTAAPTTTSKEPRVGPFSIYDLMFPVAGAAAGYYAAKAQSDDTSIIAKPGLMAALGAAAGILIRRDSIMAGVKSYYPAK